MGRSQDRARHPSRKARSASRGAPGSQVIQIQIVTANDAISAAIRFSTRSWASHAEFFDTGTGLTLGAKQDGVKQRLMSQMHYSRIERYTAPGIEQAFAWAMKQIGKSYDFSAIFGIALNRNWRDQNKWFCSELIAAAFEQVSKPLLNPSADVWRITPRDLLLSQEIAPCS